MKEPRSGEGSPAQRFLHPAAARNPARTLTTCLTCPLFVTTAEFLPDHRRQLAATRQLISKADEAGHSRLAESNCTVERNLLRIIIALVEPGRCCGSTTDDGGCACDNQPPG